MIIETIKKNGCVERKSDRGVLIKNIQTGEECGASFELPNDERIRQGLEPYYFVETEKIVTVEENMLENGLIERKSKNGRIIRNEQTGFEYAAAIDLPNYERKMRGLPPYSYVETERNIDEEGERI